jgi:ectoine hydroxylase-related dioxygenase (phytanoyl-CoA dioxygenase family)
MDESELRGRIETEGWLTTLPLVTEAALCALEKDLVHHLPGKVGRGGVRNLLDTSPAVKAIARASPMRDLAEGVLGPRCGAVRAIFFDKTPETNWKVIWHQDLTIAVRERREASGYGPWSVKEGVIHVQPPVAVLENMLAIRLHLDDCDADNGPVRIIPGTHRAGRLSIDAVDRLRSGEAVECHAGRGAILAFRPLLLHASSAARTPRHRRVLHIEYAEGDMPVQWQTWVD